MFFEKALQFKRWLYMMHWQSLRTDFLMGNNNDTLSKNIRKHKQFGNKLFLHAFVVIIMY